MGSYDAPKAGDWIRPVRRGYKLACCDCSLVHLVNFRIRNGRIEFQVFRANRSTALMRRHRCIKVKYHTKSKARELA